MVLPPYLAVVDDDESVAKALKRLLKSLPWDVRTFGSSRDFLRAIAQRLPELAILDVQMP